MAATARRTSQVHELLSSNSPPLSSRGPLPEPPQVTKPDRANHERRRSGIMEKRSASNASSGSSATVRPLPVEVHDVVDVDEHLSSPSRRKRRRVIIDAEREDVIELKDDSSSSSDEEGVEQIDESATVSWRNLPQIEEKPRESPTILSEFTCVICFDQPDILAATPCGHLYCYDCIYRALSAGTKATATTGECSVCRRKVPYKRVLPLEMKLGEGELDEVEEAAAPKPHT
ncbi:hypothetical protein V1525DRAFT_396685 [Lipomyces kononenkoae]|uniref:Uncharacterized protein n=1 Tax=Lipomyces kononenkoae TaxID=34357 RepID=A0ACC3T817_LIPKO